MEPVRRADRACIGRWTACSAATWATSGRGRRRRPWIPATEINRDDEGWKVRVALPGIDPKEVSIDLNGNNLTIAGERTRTEADGRGPASEFHYGRFERAFTLPANVDAEKVSAAYVHGVLELTLPLAETAKPRRIAIGTGGDAKVEHAA